MKRILQLLSARNLRIALVGLPWVLGAVYLLVFAADRYQAESIIAVRQTGETGFSLDGLGALFGGSGPSTSKDELMLEAHILSMDMMLQLDERLNLREAFAGPRSDPFFRLRPDATREQMLQYFRDRVDIFFDERSALLRIRTQAFTPEMAYRINRELISISEQFINESSHRLAREQMLFAEEELLKANDRMNDAKLAILKFQDEHGVLDPMAQAQANTGLTAELQATLARLEAELKGLLGYLNEDAPQARSLEAQIAGVRSQLEYEERRGTSAPGGTQLNALAADFQLLLAAAAFAEDNYRLALTAIESARVESVRKLKSLVLVESPVIPESAEYPRRVYNLTALLLGLALLYGIARLVVATIEDHQE